jgi:hypothetical protein
VIFKPLAEFGDITELNFTFEFRGGKWWGKDGTLTPEK